MATFRINFYSKVMNRMMYFNMFLPNDPREHESELVEPIKTGFFLHGHTECAEVYWSLCDLAAKYRFAMVMPNGENSFYLDQKASGFQYASFVGQELVEYVRKTFRIALKREDTFVTGFSMGGYGALHTGLAYPENFGRIVALSSALITYEVSQMRNGIGNSSANYAYYEQCFGKPEELMAGPNNPEFQVKALLDQGQKIPEIYMACGTEDFLLETNRRFHTFLEQNNVPHCYYESQGTHDMVFWREYFWKAAGWMYGEAPVSNA